MIFRELDQVEELKFRVWARENHQAGGDISELWHPVVQDECRRIDRAAKPEQLCFICALVDGSRRPFDHEGRHGQEA